MSAFPRNASLVPWRADHYVTGLAWSPMADMRVTAEAYRRVRADLCVLGTASVHPATVHGQTAVLT
mgnify:CR=1 FL=1